MDPLLKRVQASGLRLSRSTVAVVQLLARSGGRVWRQATLAQSLQAQGVRINRVTLYRVLQRLQAAGWVQPVLTPQPHARALAWAWRDAGAVPSLQARFVCRVCGASSPMPMASDVEALARPALLPPGAQADALELVWHGCCAQCRPAEPAATSRPADQEPAAIRH